MNKLFLFPLFSLFILHCGGKGNPTPTPEDIASSAPSESINDTLAANIEEPAEPPPEADHFYQLEESIAEIQEEVNRLKAKVMEYDYEPPETDYTRQLKELLDNPPPAHKITLKNGSVIEGTIVKDKVSYIAVKTELGRITIPKEEVEHIEDLVLPTAEIVFIGHGTEESVEGIHYYKGKVMNQGARRADFVRVIYNLWNDNTELILSDSTFIEGTQTIYRSGIVTDTVLEPRQSARFTLEIPLADSIRISYVTREVRWEIFD